MRPMLRLIEWGRSWEWVVKEFQPSADTIRKGTRQRDVDEGQ